jgi:predicted Zn-dependent protease
MKKNKILLLGVLALILALFLACSTIDTGGGETNNVDYSGESDELLLDDEYFIGKGVTAKIVTEYPILDNNEVNEYARLIGATISAVTDTTGDIKTGYSFAILDTDEKMALAAPTGFILVSKGLMKECTNEDEFGGILANLIGLNIGKFAIDSIPTELKQKINYAFSNKDNELMEKSYFEAVDIVYNYVKAGYQKDAHIFADKEAVRMLHTIGYSTEAYKTIIGKLYANGYFLPEANLPTIEERTAAIDNAIENNGISYNIADERTARFQEMLSKL